MKELTQIDTLKRLTNLFPREEYNVRYVSNDILENNLKITIATEDCNKVSITLYPKTFYNFKLLSLVEKDKLPIYLNVVEHSILTEFDTVIDFYLKLGYKPYVIKCSICNILLMKEVDDTVVLVSVHF